MINATDKRTVDLFQGKRGRGRPVTGNAATAAERARRYRENKKVAKSLLSQVTTDINLTQNVTENNDQLEFWKKRALALGNQVGGISAQVEQLRAELETVNKCLEAAVISGENLRKQVEELKQENFRLDREFYKAKQTKRVTKNITKNKTAEQIHADLAADGQL